MRHHIGTIRVDPESEAANVLGQGVEQHGEQVTPEFFAEHEARFDIYANESGDSAVVPELTCEFTVDGYVWERLKRQRISTAQSEEKTSKALDIIAMHEQAHASTL